RASPGLGAAVLSGQVALPELYKARALPRPRGKLAQHARDRALASGAVRPPAATPGA
ncbi:Pus1, partial [Symbiodinium sp. CCMP2456]